MSKRLQVVLEEEELDEIRQVALRKGLTVSEWVRQVLREARHSEPRRSAEEKLDLIRRASRYGFPTADVEQMIAEIERGYLTES